MKVAIIGAGISGLSLGQMLEKEEVSYRIFESNNKAGGLIQCKTVDGYLYHLVGGHVFNSKNKRVLDWFWSHFEKESEFLKTKRNAKILLGENIIGYPIENNIFQLDSFNIQAIIRELIHLKDGDCPANFSEFLLSKFGKTLCELYFYPYNEKIWQRPLNEISLDWLDGKLPSPDVLSILVDNISRNQEYGMVHSDFYYPAQGGSQFIADRLSENLNIQFNSQIDKITIERDFIKVNGESFNKVAYTGDIRKLSTMVESTDKEIISALSSVKCLLSNGTSNILCECDPTDISWLYLPAKNLSAHRIIYTGSFSPSNNGDSVRSSCVVEFTGIVSEKHMRAEIACLPGNLKPIAVNQQKSSYVVHDSGTSIKIKSVIDLLNSYNFFPLGRFAEWQYYNMDKAIESAMLIADDILQNK